MAKACLDAMHDTRDGVIATALIFFKWPPRWRREGALSARKCVGRGRVVVVVADDGWRSWLVGWFAGE